MMKLNGTWAGIQILAVLVISGWQPAASAEETIGQVTAVDAAKGTIEINHIAFEVQGRSGGDLQKQMKGMKPGQAVRFEVEGKKLIRLDPLQENVDFPRLMGAPPAH